MAVEGMNRILEAQARQRGRESNQSESNTDSMEILKLMFEYIKSSNKELKDLIKEIKTTQDEIIEEIKEFKKIDNE